MATLLQKPDALSLSGNLRRFIISASDTVRFRLITGGTAVLDERYRAINGTVEVDVKHVVDALLSLSIPTMDIFQQTASAATFAVMLDDATVYSFTCVRGGVAAESVNATTFLTANWLTWQPQTKRVGRLSPEWLTYYFTQAARVKLRYYTSTGATEVVLHSATAGTCYTYNMQLEHLLSLSGAPSGAQGVVDVWVETSGGTRLSYVQRYVYSPQERENHHYIFENSLGGLDGATFTGSLAIAPETDYDAALLDEQYAQVPTDITSRHTQNTGPLTRDEARWLRDMVTSQQIYHTEDSGMRRIVLLGSDAQDDSSENVKNYTLTWRPASDEGYLNLPRSSEALPAALPVEMPSSEIFFLEARLVDLPEGSLDDTLLIPVQSPFAENWSRVSYGAMRSALMQQAAGMITTALSVLSGYVLTSTLNERLATINGLIAGLGGDIAALSGNLWSSVNYTPEGAEEAVDALYTPKEAIAKRMIATEALGIIPPAETLLPATTVEIFRLQNIAGEEEDPVWVTKSCRTLVCDGDVVAYGTAAEGDAPTSYDRLDFVEEAWPAYDATKTGWILSAALGWDLHSRVHALETAAPAHTHSNLALLETITQQRMAAWDAGGGGGEPSPALFEAIESDGTITGIRALYPLTVSGEISASGNVTATGDIVAYGSASGASTPTAYDRLDPVNDAWPAYDATKAGWILSAALGWDLLSRYSALDTRVTNLENGSGSGHTHSNLLLLETITQQRMDAWDAGGGEAGPTLFEAVRTDGTITGIRALYSLAVTGDVTATGDIVAYGSASGPSTPTAYDRLDPVNDAWPAYDATKAGWILSAALGWDLNERVTTLEQSGGGGSGSGHTHSNLQLLEAITATRAQSWDDVAALFEAIASGSAVTGIRALYPLAVTGDVTATGDVVAYGSASGASTPTAYDRLDPVNDAWPAYDATKAGWILSAALGWDLEERVTTLEQSGGGGGSGHTHSNFQLLEAITAERMAAWDNGGGGGGETGHTHANLAVLNNITQAKFDNWDSAYSAAHTHSNKSVLDGITSTKVARWDSAWDNIGVANYDVNNNRLATRNWVTDQGYLTSHQSLADYAKLTDLHSHSNKTVLDGITSTKVSNWDGAATNSHTHSNKSVLDGITSTKVSHWDDAYSDSHTHSNKTVLDGITSTKVSNWDGAATNSHTHSNKTVLDGITSTKVSHWDSAYSDSHNHSNKTVLDGITSTKVSNWDTVAAGSWLALSGGTLSGGLTGTTLAMRTATFGDASNAGSISIVRKIGNKTYTATVSIDSSGNVTITPTSTGIIIAAGTVKASGDVLGYN